MSNDERSISREILSVLRFAISEPSTEIRDGAARGHPGDSKLTGTLRFGMRLASCTNKYPRIICIRARNERDRDWLTDPEVIPRKEDKEN